MAQSEEIIASDNLVGRQYLRPELAARIGAGDSTMQNLAKAHEKYRSFYERMRAAVEQKDPAMTEEGHFLEMRALAFKTVQKAAATKDQANEAALAEIEATKAVLRSNLGLVEDNRAAEIRGHLRSLSDEKRNSILAAATSSGDAKTVAAVVSAPSYLSGVSDDRRASLKASFERQHGGDLPARIRDLEKAVSINDKTADDALMFLDRLLPNEKYEKIQKKRAAAQAVRAELDDR